MSDELIRIGQPPTTPRPPRQRGRERFVGFAMAVTLAAPLVFVVVALGSHAAAPVATATPSTFTATGEVDLIDGDHLPQGSLCRATGAYADVKQGAPVTIRDRAGRQVAVTVLDAGRADGTGRCVFTWEAANVPTDGGPYVADIAGHGTVTVTAPTP